MKSATDVVTWLVPQKLLLTLSGAEWLSISTALQPGPVNTGDTDRLLSGAAPPTLCGSTKVRFEPGVCGVVGGLRALISCSSSSLTGVVGRDILVVGWSTAVRAKPSGNHSSLAIVLLATLKDCMWFCVRK